MDPPIAAPPRQRYITSQAHFYQRKAEKEAAAFGAIVPGNFVDFPTSAADQCFLVDQMMAAMKNTTDILDNPDNNAHINCIRAKSDDEMEEKAWEAMFDAYDAQRGKRVPKLLTAYFPNFMERWEALVALMRHSKAAVADLFAISYMDRYVHNPVTELDTKLSNDHTNKLRDFNKDVKAAGKFNGSVATIDRITSVYDAAGNLVSTFVRPEKRPLSDFLGYRLAGIAKPKRVKTRTTTGDSTTPSSNSSSSEQYIGVTAPASGPMTPIREEEEDVVATTQRNEGGTVGQAEKDDGYTALENPNRLNTLSPDAIPPNFDNQYSTPDQTPSFDEQSNANNQYPTTGPQQSLREQPEQPIPIGNTAPPNGETVANLSPFFAEAYYDPVDGYYEEDVSSQVALDGRATENGYGSKPDGQDG